MRESIDPLEQVLPEPWSSRVVAFRAMSGPTLGQSVLQFLADLEYASDAGDPDAETLFRHIGAAICAQLQLNDIVRHTADEKNVE